MTTELAQMKIFALRVPEPGGAAIIFQKKLPKLNFTNTFTIKKP